MPKMPNKTCIALLCSLLLQSCSDSSRSTHSDKTSSVHHDATPAQTEMTKGTSQDCLFDETRRLLPWPPPTPTSSMTFPKETLSSFDTIGSFNDALVTALHGAGYYDLSYFTVTNGYAVATQIEKVDDDGSPSTDARWAPVNSNVRPKGWSDWFNRVLFDQEGYYRIFLFVVTTDQRRDNRQEPKFTDASGWAKGGCLQLPSVTSQTKINDRQFFYVSSYVFSARKGRDPVALGSFGASAAQQMKKTGLHL